MVSLTLNKKRNVPGSAQFDLKLDMIPLSLARRVGRERSQESPKKKDDAISKRKRVIPPSYDCPVALSTDAGGKYQKAG